MYFIVVYTEPSCLFPGIEGGIRMRLFAKSVQERGFILLIILIIGCGQGGGCGAGCGLEPSDGFEEKDKITPAGQIRVTESGLAFLEENLEPILASVLPENGLDICIPGDGGDIIGLVEWGFCNQTDCTGGQLGCGLTIDIGAVALEVEEPSRVQARVVFDELSADIPIQATPIVDCSIGINGAGFELTLPVDMSTPEPNRYLNVELAGQPQYELSNLNIRLRSVGGGLSFLCDAIDGVINLPFIGDLIFDALQDLLDGVLYDQLASLFETFTCRTCRVLPDCQDYAAQSCTDGICRAADDSCIVAPLGIDGRLDLGALLGGLLMTPQAPVDLLAVPGDFVQVENGGLSMGLVAGFKSPRDRCVPPIPPPEVLDLEPSPLLRGGMTGEEAAYDLGFGLTKSALDRLLWSFYNTGGLCIQVGGDTISQLNTSLLGVIFPDLANLARNPRAPIAITLSPQQAPKSLFGTNLIEYDEEGIPSVTDPLLRISIDELWLDFHVFMDDRWVRFASLHTNVDLPLAIDFAPNNALVPLLGDLSQALGDLRIENTDLLRGDSSLVVTLLPMLINVFAGGLVTDLVEPIELPNFLGFELDLEGTQFTGIEDGQMLAVFTSLRASSQMQTSEVRTSAHVVHLHMPDYQTLPALGIEAWRKIWLDVDVSAQDSHLTPSEMEVSYKVDETMWSPFQPVGRIRVKSPQFLLQGDHTIRFRARRVGDYRSLDTYGEALEVRLDNVPPSLSIRETEGDAYQVQVSDLVSSADDLVLEVIGPSGPVHLDHEHVFIASEPGIYTVRVQDESGNVSTDQIDVIQSPLIGRVAPAARESGGCQCDQSSSAAAPALYLLLLIAMLGLPRRKIWPLLFVLFAVCFSFSGCSDENAAKQDTENADMSVELGCLDNRQCAQDDEVCIDGRCQVLDCATDQDCTRLSCSAGQSLCAPDGVCACVPDCENECGDGEYCCGTTNQCESLISGCEMPCDDGYQRDVESIRADRFECRVIQDSCTCEELPPLDSGLIGRFASMTADAQKIYVSAYAEAFGDLVVGIASIGESLTWHWVDGIPLGAPIVAAPSGPRGGVEAPGLDVGKYTDIAVDADGNVHVAYYAVEPGALRYAFGVANVDGTYAWTTLLLDEAGDAGRWASISLDEEGRPGIAYNVRDLNGISQLRYLFAQSAMPTNRRDWATPFLLQARPIPTAGDQAAETYPEGTGLFTSQARDSDGFPVVAWYDRTEGKLWTTRFAEAGFTTPEMVAGWGHPNETLDGDMGTNVHVALDSSDQSHLCFQDGNTDSLRYAVPSLGITDWVDDGVWIDTGGRGQSLHVVGEDCQMLFDDRDQPIIVYQDSTQQALLMRRKNQEDLDGRLTWSGRQSLRVDIGDSPRAYGFYASSVVVDQTLWVGHLVYERSGEREGYFEIFSVDL